MSLDTGPILFTLDSSSLSCDQLLAGGKAKNLWLLGQMVDCPVPPWFVITTSGFDHYIEANSLSDKLVVHASDLKDSTARIQSMIMEGIWPDDLREIIEEKLSQPTFSTGFVAVRSSGTDEDSASHSFAGQFESYLFQSGIDQILSSIKHCWCSCFSERVMSHRLDVGMSTKDLKMAVIVQVMVNSEVSGVAFSRHPLKPVSSDCVFIEAVYGLGEGLVSGELEADRYEVSRKSLEVMVEVLDKSEMFVQCDEGGVVKVKVDEERVKEKALSDEIARDITQLMMKLEEKMGTPQDFEWGWEKGQLYCLQARPVVTLPPSCFFDYSVPGRDAILFDNSNIVESYSGVTSPLTFSFASRAYEMGYTVTLLAAGVPQNVVDDYKPYLSNMLGLVRGNIYYNLMNWYRCLTCIPVGDTSKYMDTMMGVKQSLDPRLEAELGSIQKSAPKYSLWTKMKLIFSLMHKIYCIDRLVDKFFIMFNKHYEDALNTDFNSLSLQEQIAFIKHLFNDVLRNWYVPLYNDTYVMLFFGILKKLVSKYLTDDPNKAQSLQNDLLCGQGNVESTEPTKMLMRIAEHIDTGSPDVCKWFLTSQQEVLDLLAEQEEQDDKRKKEAEGTTVLKSPSDGLRQRKGKPFSDHIEHKHSLDHLYQDKISIIQAIQRFLKKYGFRCINELKLEENTLHDDPGFVLDAICGYIRTKSYSIQNMEVREMEIRRKAEEIVQGTLSLPKRLLFNWVLFHARRAVRHRENMRFSRTKLFGVFRTLFRAIGYNLVKMKLLDNRQDVFYLTLDELYAFVEGRSVTNDLRGLVELRRKEFDGYRKGLPPPERFMTTGACGIYFLFPQVLSDLDMLKELEAEASSDPNVLKGTPCCPGVVTGTIRVVHSITEALGLDKEILVTARTDPGWVPLYPLCSGLVIERGSLLSHSAVVARELGLPTIVGVSGGLMKTGMKIHMDAGRGVVTILHEEEGVVQSDKEEEEEEEEVGTVHSDKEEEEGVVQPNKEEGVVQPNKEEEEDVVQPDKEEEEDVVQPDKDVVQPDKEEEEDVVQPDKEEEEDVVQPEN